MASARSYIVTIGDIEVCVAVDDDEGRLRVSVDGDEVEDLEVRQGSEPGCYSILAGHRSIEGYAKRADEAVCVDLDGDTYVAAVVDQRLYSVRGGGFGGVRAGGRATQHFRDPHLITPMPGVVVEIKVLAGQDVLAGQSLLTLEAMKMRNDIKAQADATIEEVLVVQGQTVAKGDVLLRFSADRSTQRGIG